MQEEARSGTCQIIEEKKFNIEDIAIEDRPFECKSSHHTARPHYQTVHGILEQQQQKCG